MNPFIGKNRSFKRFLKYLFFVVFIFWTLVWIFLIYNYYQSSSEQVVSKWGTFVEWIFWTTSFLPYLQMDAQSNFYQWLMFRKCLEQKFDADWNIEYEKDLCTVKTNDDRIYTVSLNTGNTWSNGVLISIDDIFFTYNDIIKNNKLGLKPLEKYNNIEVELKDNTVQINFPSETKDNLNFFTHYILPQHALLEPNIDMYQQSFALETVYNNCAKIFSQSKDQYSLIFDLNKCSDTNLGFYQIKNIQDFNEFATNIRDGKASIVDVYQWDETLPGYETKRINTNKYAILFFNTESSRFRVRVRRALAGFINTNLHWEWDKSILKEYNNDLFNYFLSTGKNIQDFMDTISSTNELSSEELTEWWVISLPKEEINIKWTNKALAYYTESQEDSTLKFTVDQKYDSILLQHNQKEAKTLKTYNKSKKTFSYTFSKQLGNLVDGLNTYSIYAMAGKKKIKLANINIYKITEERRDESKSEPLKLIYINNKVSINIINELKEIFKEWDIYENFIFQEYENTDDLKTAINSGDYDIVLSLIDFWLKNEFTSLFIDEDNLSKYDNNKFLLYLNDYYKDSWTKNLNDINNLYANDMPFLILGTEHLKLQVKPETRNKLENTEELHEFNRRETIYHNLSLTKNIYINTEKAFNIGNFWTYLLSK